MPNKLLFGGWAKPAKALIANYSIKPRDCGTIFTNRGATGVITLTLPKVQAGLNGFWCEVVCQDTDDIIVAADAVDTLMASADAAADSVTINVIGHGVRIWCDGVQYYAQLLPGAATTVVSGVTLNT
jgi:hypothetical protein